MLPNTITLLRLPLLGLTVGLLYAERPGVRLLAAGLVILLILLDSIDGIVARAMGQTTLLGSVLDIAADRAVELVMWVVLADLGLIPVIIPLVVIVRGVFVDALRAMAPAQGLAPFDLVQTRLGRFLVGSPWLRAPYGIVKATAFCLLALEHAARLGTLTDNGAPWVRCIGRIISWPTAAISAGATVTTWAAMALCLLRGLPVCVEGPRQIALMDRERRAASRA